MNKSRFVWEPGDIEIINDINSIEIEKKIFIHNEIIISSIIASLQRSGSYKKSELGKDHSDLREHLENELINIGKKYTSIIDEDSHNKEIIYLSDNLSSKYGHLLEKGRFRIGPSQKAINLYLKYLWCIGEILIPPHCPFDQRVILALPMNIKPAWTKIDDINDYKQLVESAKLAARGRPLAEWELTLYNK
jgi:hypothetical protein